MASVGQGKVWQSLLLWLYLMPGVMAADTVAITALVASAAVAFVMFVVVVVMLIIGFTWNNWYPAMQRGKGRVKMPREYWKKKEEARLRLISGSRSIVASEAGLPNGGTLSRVQDTAPLVAASWVQGWNNAHPVPSSARSQKAYEEKDLTMELGEEEKEEDFTIETTVVDDETLDLGPFRDGAPRQLDPEEAATAVANANTQYDNVGPEEDEDGYLYSTVDKSRPTSTKSHTQAGDDVEEGVTSFSQVDPSLVAL